MECKYEYTDTCYFHTHCCVECEHEEELIEKAKQEQIKQKDKLFEEVEL